MDKSQLAIIISIFSVTFAAISLGWNIYRDVLLKAKVVVSFAVKNIFEPGMPTSPDYIGIQATNHGPGPVILNSILIRERSILKKIMKKEKYAILIHDYTNPSSGVLPKKLEVGETIDLFLDYNESCFLKGSFTQLGISDSFGRTNWAPKKTMKELRKKWAKKFNKNT